jgi:hypothetical protein
MNTTQFNTNTVTDATTMSRKDNQRRRYSRLLRVVVAALGLAIASVIVTAQGAFAWSYDVGTGTRGNVSLPTMYVGDLLMPTGLTQFTLYGNTGPIVGRNPLSTGDQIIGVQYIVEQFNGANWVTIARSTFVTGRLRAGQTSIQFAAPYIQPLVARGYFRVTWYFTWSTATGSALGATAVVPNLTSDHMCVTKIRLCQMYAGYVRTGRNLTSW